MFRYKIIFLSVFGVLNSDRHFSKSPKKDFDSKAMNNLNQLCQRSNAQVVVICGLRINHAVWDLQERFNSAGFTGNILSRTPQLTQENPHICTGNEIKSWMYDNKSRIGNPKTFYQYVILTPTADILYEQRNNIIQTKQSTGLTKQIVNQAIKILC